MESFLPLRDGTVFSPRDGRVSAVAASSFLEGHLLSPASPPTLPPLVRRSWARKVSGCRVRALKRLKVTERETDNVNQFSKLGLDRTCPIDGSEFNANGMPAESS